MPLTGPIAFVSHECELYDKSSLLNHQTEIEFENRHLKEFNY